jgi:hypothetical protein
MMQVREAIALFFDVPAGKIHACDELRRDYDFESFEPGFVSVVVRVVLDVRRVTPGRCVIRTRELNDFSDLVDEVQRVLDSLAGSPDVA